jgi:hypothetical protein
VYYCVFRPSSNPDCKGLYRERRAAGCQYSDGGRREKKGAGSTYGTRGMLQCAVGLAADAMSKIVAGNSIARLLKQWEKTRGIIVLRFA